MSELRIELLGRVPSKANRMKPGGRGRPFKLDDAIKAQIDWLQYQCNQQAARHSRLLPLRHPEVRVTFFQTNGGQDRDNKLKTLLDVLRTARVIADDNCREFNGRLVIEGSTRVPRQDERTVIELRTDDAAESASW